MNALFDDIVRLFQAICRQTGLRYTELNILVYCLLVPASWYLIVWFRRRKGLPLLLAHLALPVFYYLGKTPLAPASDAFYQVNIRALEWIGKAGGMGYVGISLVMGVGIPGLVYTILLWSPKRRLFWAYGIFMGLNLLYYGWVISRF
jgi:hypothetical protein